VLAQARVYPSDPSIAAEPVQVALLQGQSQLLKRAHRLRGTSQRRVVPEFAAHLVAAERVLRAPGLVVELGGERTAVSQVEMTWRRFGTTGKG
jgi:hypothetical protein